MKFLSTAVAVVLAASPTATAFTNTKLQSVSRNASPRLRAVDPSQQLTEYMSKAHEDKLRAVKEAEDKKNSEIAALKSEIRALKEAPGALAPSKSQVPANLDVSDMTKEQLAAKLLQYQEFMTKYIVEAQQAKTAAIEAAKRDVANQYEEKMKRLSAGAPAVAVEVIAPAGETANKLYQDRSAKVAAAAAAGKSRWGDMENAKATSTVTESANGVVQVNGVAAGVIPELDSSPGILVDTRLYDKRNARVTAAGKAGKSRWGPMEIEKAAQMATALPSGSAAPTSTPVTSAKTAVTIEVTPEITAADHGLRNDGGVGGPSLAERVNLGAQLVSSSVTVSVPPVSGTSAPSLYDLRNARVAAAGKAGKSRWGAMETEKSRSMATALPTGSTAPVSGHTITVTPEIEAADHGLRNDGGVGGPSLAERVNLGASIVGR